MTDTRPRRRIWLKGFLVLLLVSITAVTAWWYVGNAKLQAKLDALAAQQVPANGAELNEYYRIPDGVTDSTDLWIRAIDAVNSSATGPQVEDLPIIGMGETPVPSPGEPWEQLEQSREFLEGQQEAMDRIHAAASAEGCVRFPVDFRNGINADLTMTQDFRAIARLLLLDAHVAAHDDKDDRALQDVRRMNALALAIRAEPTLISQLVRMAICHMAFDAAIEFAAGATWTDAELASLQDLIRSHQIKDGVRTGIIGERALCLEMIKTTAPGLIVKSNSMLVLQLFEQSLEALDGRWVEAIATQQEITATIQKQFSGFFSRIKHFAALLLLPAQEQAVLAGARAAAKQRCAICAIAIERFRKRHQRVPATLDEIEIELFSPSIEQSNDTTDPFTGKSLLYVVSDESLLIYSVGSDGNDDGGIVSESQSKPPLDVGFLLRRTESPAATAP